MRKPNTDNRVATRLDRVLLVLVFDGKRARPPNLLATRTLACPGVLRPLATLKHPCKLLTHLPHYPDCHLWCSLTNHLEGVRPRWSSLPMRLGVYNQTVICSFSGWSNVVRPHTLAKVLRSSPPPPPQQFPLAVSALHLPRFLTSWNVKHGGKPQTCQKFLMG